jgi:hypothetical protein
MNHLENNSVYKIVLERAVYLDNKSQKYFGCVKS